MTMLQWVIGVCNKGWVMGEMGKCRLLGGVLWRERLYVGHWEGEVGVPIGKELVYEISSYICVEIYCFWGTVHVNSY